MLTPPRQAWIGFDPREAMAFAVARETLRRGSFSGRIHGLVLSELRRRGLYWRPTEVREVARPEGGTARVLWDVISDHPMSTEFAISRFLVPELAGSGWGLFMDCDIIVRRPIYPMFNQMLGNKAVYVVKHRHQPVPGVKMDNQVQSAYARKNWSSVMLFNVEHPANQALTVEMVNTLPGRDLHRFCWLKDEDIGDLPVTFNWLVGHSPPEPRPGPHIAHFTDGIPTMPGYENCDFADEWRGELERWASFGDRAGY